MGKFYIGEFRVLLLSKLILHFKYMVYIHKIFVRKGQVSEAIMRLRDKRKDQRQKNVRMNRSYTNWLK